MNVKQEEQAMSKSVPTSSRPLRDGLRDDNGQDTDKKRRWAWTAIVACAATLAIAFISALFPHLPSGQDYTRGFAPWGITALAATLGVVTVLTMRTRALHA